MRVLLVSVLVFWTSLMLAQRTSLPDDLTEVSAVAKVDDKLIWMNDSGHPFVWFYTDEGGNLIDTIGFDIENIDVEDMTFGARGHIFVADIGNNLHNRKDLVIHKFDKEGNYKGPIQFNYPDQQLYPPAPAAKSYNAEAVTYYDSNLHIFTKADPETAGFITHHYIVPVLPGSFTAKLMESIVLPERIVTAAAVSPDGNKLALLGYRFNKVLGIFPSSKTSVFVFPITNKNYFFNQDFKEYKVPSKGVTQYEALEWLDDQTLIVGSEMTVSKKQHFQTLNVER